MLSKVGDRCKTMDVARGIAIIVMIMGHTCLSFEKFDFSLWYHAWHMPVFYIVSGCFFSGRLSDIKSFVTKKARQLLIPFFFWGLVDYIYSYMCNGNWDGIGSAMVNSFFVRPTNGMFPIAGALWFLPALFWIEAIYIVLTRIFLNLKLLFLATIIIGICGMVAADHGIYLPFGLDSSLVGIPFMAGGEIIALYWDKRVIKELMHMRWYVFIVLFIMINGLFFFNGEVNFRTGIYTNYLLTYFNAFMGFVLLFNISRIIVEWMDGKYIKHLVPDILAIVGMDSIIYLCTNQMIISLVQSQYCAILDVRIASVFTTITSVFIGYIMMLIFSGSSQLKKYVGR